MNKDRFIIIYYYEYDKNNNVETILETIVQKTIVFFILFVKNNLWFSSLLISSVDTYSLFYIM